VECEDNWLGRSGSGMWQADTSKVIGPALCQLRTDELATASKYWMYRSHAGDMSPVSLIVGHRQKLGLCPLLHWLVRERSWVWTRGSVSRRAVDCVGSPFFGSSGICPNLSPSREGLLHVDHVRYVWSWTIHGLSVRSVWCVSQVFPYRVYIDSNHRDSRIWVTACLW
jgi:hypothetical protein